uniref:Leucine-rich repeat-containing N-terminal plant-type domain-containing protein n=1 Tax=Picea sitchensis TaxID=3332 RepID=A9NSI2_PICSI|nr:unknown [Picea sitchensis]ACN39988.1 unknown [Picea sitchensis]
MEICYVPSLFFFYLIILLIPFVFSTLHLSNPRHPHLSNASDHEALLGFMSAITPSPLSTTWKPNVSFCNWTGITCSRRRPRVVSLNVSGMQLQASYAARRRRNLGSSVDCLKI